MASSLGRSITSIIHNDHVLTVLCGKPINQVSHYEAWSEREKAFLQKHFDSKLEHSSCSCIAHQKEAQRAHPEGYIPKWKRNTIQGFKRMCASQM